MLIKAILNYLFGKKEENTVKEIPFHDKHTGFLGRVFLDI